METKGKYGFVKLFFKRELDLSTVHEIYDRENVETDMISGDEIHHSGNRVSSFNDF